jgi:hypothetical protein
MAWYRDSSTFFFILHKYYKLWSSWLYNCLHSHVSSSLLVLDILLSTLFSHTLSLCSSFYRRDQVSCPYWPTSKTMFLHFKLYLQSEYGKTDSSQNTVIVWDVRLWQQWTLRLWSPGMLHSSQKSCLPWRWRQHIFVKCCFLSANCPAWHPKRP